MYEPSEIKAGVLERVLGVGRANKVRDAVPFLTPLCTWGLRIRRCGESATVRHRVGERYGWGYSCDRHAFHPNYLDILGRVDRPGNGESDWEWLGEEREVPIYPVPKTLPEQRTPYTSREDYQDG